MTREGHKGLFITFEGGDGAGKSTLIEGIRRYLAEKSFSVLITREPGGTPLGETIRQWLLVRDSNMEISSKAELLLFLASRVQHIEEVIAPTLKNGGVVLCDRFNDSSIAYQGVGRNLGMDYVERLCQEACQETIPDLTFYLDLDPNLGLARRQQAHGSKDRIEGEEISFHQKVRQGFLELAGRHPRIHIIDASQNVESVLKNALDVLEPLLQGN